MIQKMFDRTRLPNHVVIALVSATAFNGAYTKNPFRFQDYDLCHLFLKVGDKSIPAIPLEPSFQARLFTREYFRLFTECGKMGGTRGNLIDEEDFHQGTTLFPFDLSPDQCNGGHIHTTADGTMSVEIAFAKPLPETVTLLVFSSFAGVVSIHPITKFPTLTKL